MVGAHLTTKTRESSVCCPPSLVVVARVSWPRPGYVAETRKARVQDGKYEVSVRSQQAGNALVRTIKIVDIRQSEVANDDIKLLRSECANVARITLDVDNAERLVRL